MYHLIRHSGQQRYTSFSRHSSKGSWYHAGSIKEEVWQNHVFFT
jgi:hypothetical protein